MKPTEALDTCIEAALFIGPIQRLGLGQVVLKMAERNPELAEALQNLSSDALLKLRQAFALRFTSLLAPFHSSIPSLAYSSTTF